MASTVINYTEASLIPYMGQGASESLRTGEISDPREVNTIFVKL